MIPKAGGGQRGLGIPNVVDRVVMEAVRQVLEPLFEPTFHASSHGFRPGRSCHTAIAEAKQHVRDGYEWVVDIDLEKFFDRVNHQRLIARLAQRVGDRRLLVLIGRMLKAKVVLPDGVVIGVDEGVPQGSPLSPLLSNIVLDELDTRACPAWSPVRPLRRRLQRLRASERAGQRVMASLSGSSSGACACGSTPASRPSPAPRTATSSDSACARPQGGAGPWRCCSRSAPSATREHASASSRREPGEARWKAASTGSTRGCADGTSSSGSPRPRSSRRCARRRPHPAAAARDPAAPLETSTNDRSAPRRAGRQAAVARGARSTPARSRRGPSATPGRRSRPAQRVLHAPRAGLGGRAAPADRPAISAPAHPTMALEQG